MAESAERDARHQARMQRKKALIDAKIAQAQDEYGLLLVHAGNGKGKSSAAFGVVARALGHGMKVAVIQFIKGRSDTGEEAFFIKVGETMPDRLVWHVTGEGFTWDTQDLARDMAVAEKAWDIARQYLADPDYGLVVLDEFTYPMKWGWVDVDEVVATLRDRPGHQHVIITGRSADPRLVEAADLVVEMTKVKHPMDAGQKGQRGIEW